MSKLNFQLQNKLEPHKEKLIAFLQSIFWKHWPWLMLAILVVMLLGAGLVFTRYAINPVPSVRNYNGVTINMDAYQKIIDYLGRKEINLGIASSTMVRDVFR